MGVGASRRKNEVISSNKKRVSRSPPLRGTSRSPPEAWDTRSEPDVTPRVHDEDEDWANVTNNSYNLLDLEPFYHDSPLPPSPTPVLNSPSKRKRRSSSPQMKNKRSLSPVKTWRSPSPDRKKKSPLGKRNGLSNSYDKYRDFRNLTEERDRKLRTSSPEKGKPYAYLRRKSPEKKPPKSPAKKLPKSPEKTSKIPRSPEKKSKIPRSPEKKNLPALKDKKLSNSWGKDFSPYDSIKKNGANKENRNQRRRNSLPELEVPKKGEAEKKAFKKPNNDRETRADGRRLSDVSTVEIDEKPVFRPIKSNQSYTRRLPTKPKSSESFTQHGSPYSRSSGGKSLDRSQYGRKKKSPPQTTTSVVANKSLKSKAKNNEGLLSRGASHGSIGSELSFTNISAVKSATNSLQSTRSNFEINAKIDKFNDKKQTLALMDLSKHTVLNNSFRDAKMPGGPHDAYEQAKKDLGKEEWESKITGIEKIVTIARKAPEVLRNDLKAVVQHLLEELKNLRSQVCRAAALAWAELFFALGKSLEPYIDNVVIVLLQKSADTNKFIREGCVEALLSMVENVSVNKAVVSVCEGGINHKSVVVKAQVAMLIDHVITAIGPERFYGASKDTQICVINNGTKMLSDGSLDVRTYAKHMFGVLARHANFEPLIKEIVPERDLRSIQKTLDAIMSQQM